VEISLDHLATDNLRRQLVVQKPVAVLEGRSAIITADHLDIGPLKRAINAVVPRTTAQDLDVFFVVKDSPINGVLQVTLTAFSVAVHADLVVIEIYNRC